MATMGMGLGGKGDCIESSGQTESDWIPSCEIWDEDLIEFPVDRETVLFSL